MTTLEQDNRMLDFDFCLDNCLWTELDWMCLCWIGSSTPLTDEFQLEIDTNLSIYPEFSLFLWLVSSILPYLFDFKNVFSNTQAKGSSSSRSPAYLTGDGVDNHTIEVRSKLYPFAQRNLDENVIHLFENTLVLGPHWFSHVLEEMTLLFKGDAEAPLCFQSPSALASHTWVSKNLSRSFPSSEVRNSRVKWADWIDRLLPRYGARWKRVGIYDEKEVDVSTGDEKKGKEVEEEEEIPAEIIAEKHSAAIPEPEAEAKHSISVLVPEVEEDRTLGTLAVVTSPLKPPIVAVSITCS
ncbi:hypothetical protein L3X38_033279 [Prunus dulcis]|uniref:Uncharacterized protein n=1 Tax=Prunus dulcis TaxID=3755 RepID=A0AAD4VGQ6_PRUDU|nr:hypothetical protein L3X38_033279 [Prunus dulcis]